MCTCLCMYVCMYVCYACTLCKEFFIKFPQLDVANMLGKTQMSNNSLGKNIAIHTNIDICFQLQNSKWPKCPTTMV